MTHDDEYDLLDLGPLDFFERYRQLPTLVPITINVIVSVPREHEAVPGILYCGKHVHVALPAEMPYSAVLAIMTQAYAVARAFTVSCGMRFNTAQLVAAASETAEALGFDPASTEALRSSIEEWHDKIRQVTTASHLN